jgi:hypothetical protein
LFWYFPKLLKNFFYVVGAWEILGNPYGIVGNIVNGVQDFVTKPVQGLMQSPNGLWNGLKQGTSSLILNYIHGVSNASHLITNALRKGISSLAVSSLPISYWKPSLEMQSPLPQNINLIDCCKLGFKGVVDCPYDQYKSNGIVYGLKGFSQGLFGLFMLPTIGMLNFSSDSTAFIKRLVDPNPPRKRLRQPFPFPATVSSDVPRAKIVSSDFFPHEVPPFIEQYLTDGRTYEKFLTACVPIREEQKVNGELGIFPVQMPYIFLTTDSLALAEFNESNVLKLTQTWPVTQINSISIKRGAITSLEILVDSEDEPKIVFTNAKVETLVNTFNNLKL